MNLEKVLDSFGIKVEDCVVVTIGSDGLNEDSHILELVTQPVITTSPDAPIYIEGGDVAAAAPYTGINPHTYAMQAVTKELAAELFAERVAGKVLVGHNITSWGIPLLMQLDPVYSWYTTRYIDTLPLARLMMLSPVPKVKYTDVFNDFILHVVNEGRGLKGDLKLDSLCPFDVGWLSTLPEVKAVKTVSLFAALLRGTLRMYSHQT